MTFSVAGLQLQLGNEDNRAHIAARVAALCHTYPWVQMVVLSELAAFGHSTKFAEPLPGPTEQWFSELAHKHGVWLLNGSVFERAGEQIFNTATVFDPVGKVVGRYRKLFPFRPYEAGVEAGDSFLVFDVPHVGRFGVSICYDLWFPETVRTLAAMGAEVILHPSMTTTVDRDVELSMARAMAVMNSCYIIDINGAGAGGNGRSIWVGPEGDILHTASSVEEMMPLPLDLARVRRVRERGIFNLGQPLKSFRDRKIDFSVFQRGAPGFEYLQHLGPLAIPKKDKA